ncbi:hypothetical protein ACWDZ4_20620 [Streptomyces sp. NPDC003016]
MTEGLQAGRLEVTVVAALDGFARELRTKVETAAEGLAAKVQVKVDDDGLRERLEKAVKKASEGVSAKIKVTVDQSRLRGELNDVARQLSQAGVTVPVRADDGGATGGSRGGLLGRIRSLLQGAQGEADQSPVQVPVSFKMPGGRRGRMRGLLLGAIVSLAQPAVAWIGQLGAGLTALGSAAAPAVGIVGTLPGLIAAAGLAAISASVAFGGFGEALKQTLKAQAQLAAGEKLTEAQQQALDQSMKGLSKSARETAKAISGVSGEWKAMRRSVQEQVFSQIEDQVKPLSDAVLPRLEVALGSSANQVGNLFRQMSKGAQTKSFAKDFDQVAASSGKVTSSLVGGLKNVGHAVGDFLVASGPAVERVALLTEGWTKWLRASTESNRADGSLDRFLQRSIDKSKQLLRTTVDLGHGLAGVGRAASESGNSLLKGLEFQMTYFNAWANSAQGQQRMKSFFDQSLPVYRETIGLLGDLGKGLAKMATDDGLVRLVQQIRYELMPAVGSFLDQLGRAVGPQLISLVASLASIFEKLSAAGLGLGVVVQAFAAFAVSVNSAMEAVPFLGTALGLLLGAIIALKVLRGVSALMGGLGAAVGRTSTVLASAPGRIQAVTGAWTRAGLVYQRVAQQTGGIAGAARGATAASTVMSRGLSGVLGVVGGPLGLALAAGSIALMYFAQRQQDAAQAAADHRTQITTLADALRSSNGAIDDNVVAQARKLATETEWGRSALKAEVSTKDLTAAILGQGSDLGTLEQKLRATAEGTWHYEERGRAHVRVMTDQGVAALKAADALKKHGVSIKDARKELESTGQLQEDFANRGTSAYDRVREAAQRLADTTGDAESRTSALKDMIEALSGKTRSYEEATQRLNAKLLEMREYAKQNEGAAKGKDVVKDGALNTTNQLGQDLYRLSSGLADEALGKVTAAFDKASAAGKPLVEQLAAARREAAGAREQLISTLGTLGVGAKDAAVIADQMGLIPDTIVTSLKLDGQGEIAAQLQGVRTQFQSLKNPDATTVKVSVLDQDAKQKLTDLGFKVTQLKDGRFQVVAKTEEAKGKLASFVDTANNMPTNKDVEVSALTAEAQADLKAVSAKVASFKDKPFTMKALTGEATKLLSDLGVRIRDTKGKNVVITAPTGSAVASVEALAQRIRALEGRTITNTVVTNYTSVGKPGSYGRQLPYADGGIWKFAEGGIHRAANRVKAFANGTEKHIAQIGKPGDVRIWNEPETHGEAYLPLAQSKRTRSKAILDRVAEIFGGKVVYFADGGVNQPPSSAAESLHRTSRAGRAAAPRASVPQGNSALVGGDLNIHVGAVGTVRNALDDAMYELQRIQMGGTYA